MDQITPAAPAGIGHNAKPFDLSDMPKPDDVRTWLQDEFAAKVARRDELHAGIQRFLAANPTITDDETAGRVGDFVDGQIKRFIRVADDDRKGAKEPFLEGGRVIDKWFGKLVEPLDDGVRQINALRTAYARQKAEQERIERERAAAEARRQAEAAAEAAAAELAAQTNSGAMDAAIEASRVAEEMAARAAAPAADLSRVRGDFGSVTSLRTTWHFEVTDMFELLRAILAGKVPVSWIEINAAEVRRAIAGGKRQEAPGLRIYSEEAVR